MPRFSTNFDLLADAPNGLQKLQELKTPNIRRDQLSAKSKITSATTNFCFVTLLFENI
jgi:hypothetical protein